MKLSMRMFERYKNGVLLSFYVETDDGRRRSLKTRDKNKARQMYRQIEREYFKNRVARITGECTITIDQFRAEFMEWSKTVQKPNTSRANRLALDKLAGIAGPSTKLDMISQRHIDALIADETKKGNSAGAINNYIRHAKAVMNKAVEWQHLTKSPLAGVKEIKKKTRPPQFIPKEDIAAFLNSIKDTDLRLMATAYLVTGRRRSELVFLKWENIHLESGRYTVEISKSDRVISYQINSMFRAILLAIGPKETGFVFERFRHPDTVSHNIKDELVKFGYGSLTLHSLRHSYATMKAEEGLSLREIQGLLGHADIKATQVYAHLTEKHVDSLAEVNIGLVNLSNKGQK